MSKCKRCGLKVDPNQLDSHWETSYCKDGMIKIKKEEEILSKILVSLQEFEVKEQIIKNVDDFRYLGRVISYDGND